jgi:pyruvate/2-oxoglutarate dehydrogenase complex dihydrolipoamide acyltransferase (E2) component
MKLTVKMPRVGETVDEVYVVKWNKQIGDSVSIGDSLMEVETVKTGEAIAVIEG